MFCIWARSALPRPRRGASPSKFLGRTWGVAAGSVLDDRLPPNRKNTRWDQVLQVLVSYQLIDPGGESKLHRDWFGRSARPTSWDRIFSGRAAQILCHACHDFLLKHKADLFSHRVTRWRDLFNVEFDVLPGNTGDCKTLRMFLDKIEQ
jgi:hypothetical protein